MRLVSFNISKISLKISSFDNLDWLIQSYNCFLFNFCPYWHAKVKNDSDKLKIIETKGDHSAEQKIEL